MQEQIIITINPAPDGVRCGECKACRSMREFPPMNGTGWRRGPLCLSAARTLREEREAARRVIEAARARFKLVTDELDEVAPIAHAHGWRTTRYEAGQEARKAWYAAVAQYEAARGGGAMTLTLTPAEIGTLREIVESRLESGEYYGNAQQYRKRVETILDKINAEIIR